jgi:hypothetical protein
MSSASDVREPPINQLRHAETVWETYMMTMNNVKMMFSTPKAFDGKTVAYVEKHPTTPADRSV